MCDCSNLTLRTIHYYYYYYNVQKCPDDLTIFPYEGEAQLKHVAGVAVCVPWSEAGQKLWWHTGNRGVDVDSREHSIVLTEQAVEHQQGQGWLHRVGVYDDITESTEILVT